MEKNKNRHEFTIKIPNKGDHRNLIGYGNEKVYNYKGVHANGNEPVFDGEGGGKEEYVMLKLRLKEGISVSEYNSLFDESLPEYFLNKCRQFEKAGYINLTDDKINLTNNGMLLSNTIISELLECIEWELLRYI